MIFFSIIFVGQVYRAKAASLSNINDGLMVSVLGAMAQQLSEVKRIKILSQACNLTSTILSKQWVGLPEKTAINIPGLPNI